MHAIGKFILRSARGLALTVLLVLHSSLCAQEFQLLRGAPVSGQAGHVNGPFALNSTIGSSPAGTHANGEYQIEGGFVSAVLSPVITPPSPPFIVEQPAGATVAIGDTILFHVEAVGTPPLHYQWRFNGQPLPLATDASLVVENVQPNRAGFYSVRVSNAYGTLLSQGASLVVLAPPGIATQPVSQVVGVGEPFTLSVSAFGPPPLAYQWFHNDAPIAGATANTLTQPAASPMHAGLYFVRVSNAAATVQSVTVSISVLLPPSILTQPSPMAVDPGEQAMFSVLADGSPPLLYQWYFNGILLPGATNNILLLPNAQLAHAGLYRVQVRNLVGNVASQAAELAVELNSPVLNGADLFANRALAPLPGDQGRVVGNNTGYTLETDERRHARKPGGSSTWFLWTPANSGIGSITTLGSSFDTLLAVYTGNMLTKLVEKDSDDDSGPGHTSQVEFNAVVGTAYAVVVDGFVGETGKFVLSNRLEITNVQLPEIVSHPVRQTLPQGSTATFDVQATGTDLTYQWYFNRLPIPDATNPSLVLNNIQPSNVGTYRVWVSNQLGRIVRSKPATLELGPYTDVRSLDKIAELKPKFPQPLLTSLGEQGSVRSAMRSMNAAANATSQGFAHKFWFNGYGYATEVKTTNCCGATGPITYYATNELELVVDFSRPMSTGGILVFELPDISAPSVIVAYDTNTVCFACTNGSTLRIPVTAGSIYYPSITLFNYNDVEPVRLDIKFDTPLTNAYAQVTNNVLEGSALTLQALATNTLSQAAYQWFLNGNPIPNATNAQYTIDAVTSESSGTYQVLLSNLTCQFVSDVAVVSLMKLPTVTLAFERIEDANQLCVTASHESKPVILQGSSDLRQWTDLATNIVDGGELNFIGPLPFHFFRALLYSR